jgi:hypothetical protein
MVSAVTNPAATTADPAVAAARRVVGLYGDPTVTWSIVLALTTRAPAERAVVAAALARLVATHPHLGRVPALGSFPAGQDLRTATAFADAPYDDADPLLRASLSDDGLTLVLAAHHGAVDGLGLLGAAAAITGLDLGSSARGIEREAQPEGFVRRVLARVGEVVLHPPRRVALQGRGSASRGDVLLARPVDVARPGSAALVAGVVTAVRGWNAERNAATAPLMVAMGLSRRPGTPPAPPDRDTAFVRLDASGVTDVASAAAVIAATPPEPAYPETDGKGFGPLLARLAANRLGATVLVSNLGAVADPGVAAVRFWPVPTGPSGVAVGLASSSAGTILTVRVRRRWCGPGEAEDLTDRIAASFAAAAAVPGSTQ